MSNVWRSRFGLISEGVLRAVRAPAELRPAIRKGCSCAPSVRWRWRECARIFPVAGIGEVPRPELWVRLDALRQAGHVLLEVRPTLSLEVAFMHVVGQS